MADSKYADAVLDRFNAGTAPASSEPDGDEDDYPAHDDEAAKMAFAAFKRGDREAFCKAIRRIAGR